VGHPLSDYSHRCYAFPAHRAGTDEQIGLGYAYLLLLSVLSDLYADPPMHKVLISRPYVRVTPHQRPHTPPNARPAIPRQSASGPDGFAAVSETCGLRDFYQCSKPVPRGDQPRLCPPHILPNYAIACTTDIPRIVRIFAFPRPCALSERLRSRTRADTCGCNRISEISLVQ